MTDPAAPTTPEPFNFVRDTDGVLVQDDRHKIGHWLPAWAYHALRSKWQSEAEAGSRLGSTTPAEPLTCNHPPSMLTTSTYNGPDGRMAGVEQRCECGASWGSTTPAEALDAERLMWALHSMRVPERAHPTTNPCPLCSEMAKRIAAEYARLRSRCDCGHALRDHYANPDSDALPQPCAECPCDHFVEVETDD